MLVPAERGALFPSYLQEPTRHLLTSAGASLPIHSYFGLDPEELVHTAQLFFLKAPLISSKQGKKLVELQPSEAAVSTVRKYYNSLRNESPVSCDF